MTQGDLAESIDVSPSTIGMYEQNMRQPDISTLIKLSNFFNVTTDYILGEMENSSNQDKNTLIRIPD